MTRARRVIALTGSPQSGKSTAAIALTRRCDVRRIDVGTVLAERLGDVGVVVPHRAYIGPLFEKHYSLEAVAPAISDSLPLTGDVVLDAVRATTTCRQLQELHHGLIVWFVDAPPDERRARLERASGGALVGATERNRRLTAYAKYDGMQLANRALADVVLHNDGDAATFEQAVVTAFDRTLGQ